MLASLLVSVLILGAPGAPAPTRALPGGLETAPWQPLLVEQCATRLTEAGLPKTFRFSQKNRVQERKRRGRDTIFCHVPQASIWQRGPTNIKYYGFTQFNCAMAIAMARFETLIQEEALKIFPKAGANPVKAITHMGTYNCRPLRKKPTAQSQHSFGNAIDIKGFWIRGVGEVNVLRHWDAKYPIQKKRSDFLRNLVARLNDEGVFTNILTPEWDASHANHLHIDLAALSDGLPSAALARAKGESVDPSVDGSAGHGKPAAPE
ncbi:MAG: hypothetical protein ACI9MR_000832 [Myxococcota bacterium]|jgi:hypothetical protein